MPFKAFPMMFTVFLLVGCASLPTPRSEAVHYALLTDATLRELAQRCSQVSGSLHSLASQAERQWWRRNGNVVAAADYGLLQMNWEARQQRLEDQRAYLSMQVLDMVQSQADERVDDWLEDEGDRPEVCREELTRYQDGERDLSRNGDYFETLVELQNERKRLDTDVDQARVINARYRKYGRSLFVVERKVQSHGCNQPQISMLRNEWPLEVYDAVCTDKTYLLVQCEWGRCRVLPTE